MDSQCTGPASTITKNVCSAKNKVLTTQECTVSHFRSDVGPPPRGHVAPERARDRLHGLLCTSVIVATPIAVAFRPLPTIPVPIWSPVDVIPVQRSHFPAQSRSRLEPRTEPRGGHGRSVLRTAVGRCDLDLAHHPHPVDAWADCAPSRPSWAAFLAQRPRLCDKVSRFVTPAESYVPKGQSTTAPRRQRFTMVVCRAGTR